MTVPRLRLTAGVVALLVLMLAAAPAHAQRDNSQARPSPNAKVSQTIGTTEVDLHYSRPGVKGRQVFGDLQQWGEVWRAGANEPTTITFSDDVRIEGEPLAAGTYNIFMVPRQQGDWDVLFATPVRWGTMYDPDNLKLTVSVTPGNGPAQEWLSYRFENLSDTSADLVMSWADRTVPVTITVGD